MREEDIRALENVGAILIDARSCLEDIETPTHEMNELHGEITRAHALCWRIIQEHKYETKRKPELPEVFGASV